MQDTEIIDWAEKIRSHYLETYPQVAGQLEDLRARNYVNQPNRYFAERLVALTLDKSLDTAAGQRAVHSWLDGSAAGVAEAGGATAASQKPALAEGIAFLQNGNDDASTFAAELESAANLNAALKIVRTKLPSLSPLAAARFLYECGYPAAVPSLEARRFYYRIGMLPDQAAPAADFFTAAMRVSQATGTSLSEVNLWAETFTGRNRIDEDSTICGAKPKCERCCIRAHCTFARYYKPAQRASLPIKEWQKDDRPRERLLDGQKLSDAELIAIILRTGTESHSAVDLARSLLEAFGGSLHRLEAAPISAIREKNVKGIGPAKFAEIKAALELGRRASMPENDEREELKQITSSADVFDMYRAHFKTKSQEHFLLLTLNTKNRITREVAVSTGTLNSSIVHPRDIFRSALAESAAAVVFVHNHPSGDPAPSSEDRALTRRLVEVGKLLGIRVLDHVIIGARRHFSFADQGELE